MLSLSKILSTHSSVLLMDAASSRLQVAHFQGDQARWNCCEGDAGSGIFEAISTLKLSLNEIDAFIFSEGPGSILGIRTVASALRTWNVVKKRKVYSYRSLDLAAESLGDERALVIADARRETWHVAQAGQVMKRIGSQELPEGIPIFTPSGFRQWSKLGPKVELAVLAYELERLLPEILHVELFHECEAPDAFLHEEPNYLTWTPQIHRAPK